MIGALMLDIAGTTLTTEDCDLLQAEQVGGVILFGRNIQSARQVRDLTDHMRQVRPELLIAALGLTCFRSKINCDKSSIE